jgi:hypothetical protein
VQNNEAPEDTSEDESQDDSETLEAPKRTFKYKSSHPEDLGFNLALSVSFVTCDR